MIPNSPLYRKELRRVAEGPMPEPGSTVMITGATGMIGAFLCDALATSDRGLTVIAVARNAQRLEALFGAVPGVRTLARDISVSSEALPYADYIIHAGSNAHPLAFSTDPVGTMRANLLGTLQLLEHMRLTGGRRLLFVSSGEIYGEDPSETNGFTESNCGHVDPMCLRSCYPESKRAGETLCVSYLGQYGVSSCVVRPAYIYGPTVAPASTRADAQFLRNAVAGEDILMKSPGTQLRSYCYLTDAARALLTVLMLGADGTAYNVADRNGTRSIRQYAETLAHLAGTRLRFELPPETERRGYSTVKRAVQDPSRLEALGWQAECPPEEGLRRTLQILRESGPDIG